MGAVPPFFTNPYEKTVFNSSRLRNHDCRLRGGSSIAAKAGAE